MLEHLPVMVREVVEMLNPRPGGIYVDATVGLGGHAMEILKLIGPEGRLVGIDRDSEALRIAEARLANGRVILKKGRFSELGDLVGGMGIKEVDGVLFDFGVSMMQLKDMSRGFSFGSGESLDMRMDCSQRLRAEDIVNTYQEKKLGEIFREYGEEWLAARIARAVVMSRVKRRIRTCAELSGIVEDVYRRKKLYVKRHPATKIFQALRIAVNDEINEIRRGLSASLSILKGGGRICAITYHSLEDRVVKNFIKDVGKEGLVRVVTKKPLTPSYDETRMNPSSRSAKLRCAEKI